MQIFVLTDFPSPYQTEIFNRIAETADVELHVGYLRRSDPLRQWSATCILHNAIFLDQSRDSFSSARHLVNATDLAVFNYYLHPYAQELLSIRAQLKKPWSFWGERPGVRKPAWVGQIVRQWKLRWLHSSVASIWGVGKFAVDGYTREFGADRSYFNLPYFSDLKRFSNGGSDLKPKQQETVFLFSGSLIERKGIDLLAQAFAVLANDFKHVRLKIMGAGELQGSLRSTLHHVRDRVDFVGFKDWNELPDHYRAADVLCVPSRYDGWGLVVPEGLAAGLPVIATDRMGAGLEFIETGRNGWLIPAGNCNALLNALRDAASLSTQELSSLSSEARESVREHTLDGGARRFVQYANEAVGNWHVR